LLTTSSTFTLHLWMLWQYCCHLHIYYHVLIEQYFFKEFRWNIHTSINQMATFHYSHFREFAKVYPSLQFFMYMHTFQILDPIPFVHCCYLYWPLHFWPPHWHLLISSISTKEQVLPDLIYFMKLIYSLPCHWDLSLWQLHVYLTLAIYLSSLSIWQLHLLIMIGIATILLWYHTILMVLLSLDPYFDDAWVTELEHLSISWHSFCHKPWIDSIPKLQPPTALSEHRNTIGAVTLSAPTAIAYSCTITCFT